MDKDKLIGFCLIGAIAAMVAGATLYFGESFANPALHLLIASLAILNLRAFTLIADGQRAYRQGPRR